MVNRPNKNQDPGKDKKEQWVCRSTVEGFMVIEPQVQTVGGVGCQIHLEIGGRCRCVGTAEEHYMTYENEGVTDVVTNKPSWTAQVSFEFNKDRLLDYPCKHINNWHLCDKEPWGYVGNFYVVQNIQEEQVKFRKCIKMKIKQYPHLDSKTVKDKFNDECFWSIYTEEFLPSLVWYFLLVILRLNPSCTFEESLPGLFKESKNDNSFREIKRDPPSLLFGG